MNRHIYNNITIVIIIVGNINSYINSNRIHSYVSYWGTYTN